MPRQCSFPMGRSPPARSNGWQFAQAMGLEAWAISARLRRFHLRALRFGGQVAASARHPSPAGGWLGLPSRSSRFGASSRERRMVDQNSASWNRAVLWMRQLESLSRVS